MLDIEVQREPGHRRNDIVRVDTEAEAVAYYMKFFTELAQPNRLFDSFRDAVPEKTPERAKIVGSLWYHLSEAIVDVLCLALAKLENPRIRHFVVQTAYEELGESSESKIHTDLLRDSLLVADVDENDILAWSGYPDVRDAITSLRDNLDACTSDAEICGVLLGMELIAYENIGNVVDYLSYSDEVARLVAATEWVRLHNTLEEAHIERSVSIFVRYVTSYTARRKFVGKFIQVMHFWERFWASIARAATPAKA
ncbi:MAG: iron-containing redox enzyme family protein [Proteobacteria bacterium]|nr:iron-containing redox enzyme family protein [Pseudomonadota bacterium]